MRTPLDDEADGIVAEMMRLGASFEISRSPCGASWFYASAPSMREPLRRYRAGIDFTRPGTNDAMVRAVMRIKFVGAP